jgi:molybdopterin synthase sulfur carrier subunit
MIRLLYFAWVRERIGSDGETIALPPGVATVGGLVDWLAARPGGYAAALADRSALRVAVDQAFASAATPVRDGAEVAIFPPVTGG